MIGVLNYNAGNLTSVEAALTYLGADYRLSGDPDVLLPCDKLIFPGVGDAKFAMETLTRSGNDQFLSEFVASGKPVFGICLGAQIFFSLSEEHQTPCLNFIPGTVRRFPLTPGLKVPHMGWNQVDFKQPSHPLFAGIPDHSGFYFVHSFFIQPESDDVVAATTEYGFDFCSVVSYRNLWAAQFHPEKSGAAGLQMLRNFVFGS